MRLDRMLPGVVLLAFQITLGGLVSAHGGAKSCGTIPGCDGEWWPAGAAFALLDLIRAPDSFAGSALLADPARRALHMAHRRAQPLEKSRLAFGTL